jgi:hypothetical protein
MYPSFSKMTLPLFSALDSRFVSICDYSRCEFRGARELNKGNYKSKRALRGWAIHNKNYLTL